MVQDAHVARHDLILQNGSSGYINTISMVSDDDHSSLEKNISV